MRVIRIAALTAAAHDWSHGANFSQIINGCTRERAESACMRFIAPKSTPMWDDAKVVAIWTPDPQRSKVVADALGIEDVLDRPDEAVGHVDAVLSSDDSCEEYADRNASWARPYIAHGTPAFLDKPLSHSATEAVDIVELAQSDGAPILCCSGFRFSETFLRQRAELPNLGSILGADGAGPLGWLVFYGVHVIDPLVSLVGVGASWVQHVGDAENHTVAVGYADGKTVLFRSLRMAYGFHFSLYGTERVARFSVSKVDPDIAEEHFHVRTVGAAVEMFRTGGMPVSYEEQMEVAKILTYAKASLRLGGRRIGLDEAPPN